MIDRVLLQTIVTADLDGAVEAFRDEIGWQTVGAADVGVTLGEFLRLSPSEYPRYALMASPGTEQGFLRFVEGPEDDDLRSFHHPGLFNAEFLCRDVDPLHRQLSDSSRFEVLCDPVTYDLGSTGGACSRSFATRGPGGAGFFFTTYISVPPPRQLPVCENMVGPIFNAAVATEGAMVKTAGDRDVADFYETVLGMARRLEGRIASAGINRILDLPEDWAFHMVVYKGEGDGLIEIDLHEHALPEGLGARPGWLKPGNAWLTLESKDLSGIMSRAANDEQVFSAATELADAPYSGQQAGLLVGPAGELMEIVQSR